MFTENFVLIIISRATMNDKAAGVNPAEIAHVHLQSLLTRDAESEAAFCRSMCKLGFACLSLPEEHLVTLRNSYSVAQDFFASPKKKDYTMPDNKDVGYINMKRVKEFYQASMVRWKVDC